MAYLTFDTFTAAVPLASAATQVYTFTRPTLSALSGYDVSFSAGTGVYRVSASVAGTLVSAVQISATSGSIHLVASESGAQTAISAFDIAAGEDLVVRVAHLSGGVASDFVLVMEPNSTVVAGEFLFKSAVFDYGVNSMGTSFPEISAKLTSPAVGQGAIVATLSTTIHATNSAASASNVVTQIVGNSYLLQGNVLAFKTAASAVSALIGKTNTLTVEFTKTAPYTGSRPIATHLRGRHLGYF